MIKDHIIHSTIIVGNDKNHFIHLTFIERNDQKSFYSFKIRR